MKKTFFYLAVIAVALAACGERKTIPERKLVKILADMHLADAALEQGCRSKRRDSSAVYTAILDEYGYTLTQLHSSMAVYSRSKDDADKLYGKVCKRLEKLQKQYAKALEAERKKVAADSSALQLAAEAVEDSTRLAAVADSSQVAADSAQVAADSAVVLPATPAAAEPARRRKFLDNQQLQLKPVEKQ